MSTLRWTLGLLLGIVMIGLGLFVALRPLWTHDAVLMGARWIDLLFAGVCLLRGVVNVRLALDRRPRAVVQG